MKTSNKILLSVFFAIIVVIVLLVIIARSYFLRAITMPGPVILQTSAKIMADKNSYRLPIKPAVKPFNEVAIEGAWDIRINYGKNYSVKIKSPPAIKPYINIASVNGELKLYLTVFPRDTFRHGRLKAVIATPKLNKIKTSGASNIVFSGFNSKNFEIDTAGATHVYGKNNNIENLLLKSAGASKFDLMHSKIKNAHIKFAGASDAVLNMDGGNLTGKVVGFSSIKYAGTVKTQTIKTAGFASVKPVRN